MSRPPKAKTAANDSNTKLRFGADFRLKHANTLRRVQHPDLRADYDFANVPFDESHNALRDSAFFKAQPICRS